MFASVTHKTRFRLRHESDLPKTFGIQWAIKRVLPSSGLAAVYGQPGTGKSFIALDMAMAIAEGTSWFGCRVKQAPVAYLWLEGVQGVWMRIEAWKHRHKRAWPADFKVILDTFKLTETSDINDLASVLPAGTVVFIDTLNGASAPLDENNSYDMGQIIQAAKTLQAATQGLVVLIHHTGKNPAAGLRGHSSLLAALDAAIEVTRKNESRSWAVTKQKDGPDGVKKGFILEEVSLDTDEDGDPLTSCFVVESDTTIRLPKPAGSNQQIVLETLEPLFESGVAEVEGAPSGTLSIPFENAIEATASRLKCSSDKRNTRARDAINGLVSRGVLGRHEHWLWKRISR